jgi:hypothetical protein
VLRKSVVIGKIVGYLGVTHHTWFRASLNICISPSWVGALILLTMCLSCSESSYCQKVSVSLRATLWNTFWVHLAPERNSVRIFLLLCYMAKFLRCELFICIWHIIWVISAVIYRAKDMSMTKKILWGEVLNVCLFKL